MLNQRSANKIAERLRDEGWSEDEIDTALNEIYDGPDVVNVVLPEHFREEALFIADCHCEYVLKIPKSSPKYKKAFEKAYSTYLIEAFENSRGIEGPGLGKSHMKKTNPAGIEVFAFDALSNKNIVSNDEKKQILEKAPAGLIFMGRDQWIQKSLQQVEKKINNPETIKTVATQYSAAVVSLANTFLYAFGGYKTKRRYGSSKIYSQTSTGKLVSPKTGMEASNTLEFSKGQTQEQMLDVTYRQITRQIYIFTISSVVAGVMALDNSTVEDIKEGVKKRLIALWQAQKKPEDGDLPKLAFALKRQTREKIIADYFKDYSKSILDYKKTNISDSEKKDPKYWSPRRKYLSEIQAAIKSWSGK